MINTKGHNLYTLASLLLFLQVFLFYDGGSLISKMQARWSGIETQSYHVTRPATNVFMQQLKETKEFFVVSILMVASLDKTPENSRLWSPICSIQNESKRKHLYIILFFKGASVPFVHFG